MVTTRRRTRSQSLITDEPASKKEEDEHEDDDADDDDVVEAASNSNNQEKNDDDDDANDDDDKVEEAVTSSKKKKKTPSERKTLRKQQKEALRSKNLGLIAEETPNKSRKIVFGDDMDDAPLEEEEDDEKPESASNNNKEDEVEEEEDDDAVEQMDSKAAREMALEQREQERASTKVVKKKKRKSRARPEADADDNFEDDFFAQLDEQKATDKKNKKAKGEDVIPKHTIFQSADEEHPQEPIEVNPGMELVVLGEDDYEEGQRLENDHTMALSMTAEEPSETALYHSRDNLKSGRDIISMKQRQKYKKHGLKSDTQYWRRSMKMNRRLLTKGKGKAAAAFTVANKLEKTFKF